MSTDAAERDRTAAALLAWYRAMGVDGVVADAPTDWLARGDLAPGAGMVCGPAAASVPRPGPIRQTVAPPPVEAPAPARTLSATAPSPAAARQFPTTPPAAAESAARQAARAAATLEELDLAIRNFEGCGLKATAKTACVYRGAARASLVVVGEAPGREEDLEGKPFVGRAGQLLDRMLVAIGLDETTVHITNIVYWRPPGNRTPTPQEAQICRPFLERQIELVAPEAVLLLGGAAAKHVLDVVDGIMRIRGQWREIEVAGRRVKAMATLHPAYLLRTPAAKRLAWRDLLAVRMALAGN
jgi:uracil-DNA glycosylase family 4